MYMLWWIKKIETIKDAVIFGMNDSMLKEKTLDVDPDLEKLTRWVLAR